MSIVRDITGDEIHNRTIVRLQRQAASWFSSLLQHHSSTSTLYDRIDDYILHSSKKKKFLNKKRYGVPCAPSFFEWFQGTTRRLPATWCPPKLQNTLLYLFPFHPPVSSFSRRIRLVARDSILDPLHKTWSWSSFTAIIDLTVSFEDWLKRKKEREQKRGGRYLPKLNKSFFLSLFPHE